MKAKRLRVIVLVLAILILLIAVARFLSPNEPTYQGKSVSVWFKEYAFASNSRVLGYGVAGRNLMVLTSSGSRTIRLPVFTNYVQEIVWVEQQMSPTAPDPAWVALQALGSNAVPHLVQRLRIGRLDQTYERVFTNLPPMLQRKLSNPGRRKWYQTVAIQTIARLGISARSASPALLELLKQPNPALRREVIHALRSIYASRRAINSLLVELGAQQRYTELTEIALETGWDGSDLTGLFGQMLRSPDPALRRNAIRLLERVGFDARPALEQVTAALGDSDSEIRYLAARSLEYIGTNTPPVINALRTSLEDENVRVRIAARRALRKIAPEMTPSPDPAGAAKD